MTTNTIFTLTINDSDRTIELRDNALKATQEHFNSVLNDEAYSIVTDNSKNSKTAAGKLAKSEQSDALSAIISAYPSQAMEALCTLAFYPGYTFPADKTTKSVKFKKSERAHIYELDSAIPAFNAAGITSISPAWQSIALDAIRVCAVAHTCALQRSGIEVCKEDVYKALKASDKVDAICKKSDGSISAKVSDCANYLQTAVDAIFGLTEEGKHRYFVHSADVRAICSQFGWNTAKNALVIPQDATKIRIFFNMLRAIVGNTDYETIIEQEKANQEAEKAE